MRVVVRGKGRAASASLTSVRCRTRLVLLRYADARRVLRAAALRAGASAPTLRLRRLGPDAFVGLALWEAAPAGADEAWRCQLEMTFEKTASGALKRVVRDRACFQQAGFAPRRRG